jgi:predicted RNA-binding Zn ribbon-like protein
MNNFYLVGNNLALDLANTLAAGDDGGEIELLKNLDDLLDWAVAADILTKKQAADVRKWDVSEGKDIVDLTTGFRRELKLMAMALSRGKPVPRSAINRINEVLRQKEGHFEVRQTARGYESEFKVKFDSITDLLLPIAESAMNLLCSGDLSLVKKCENAACVLYFYDTSKRHGRRWCSMTSCGNRAKAQAFYKRKSDTKNL